MKIRNPTYKFKIDNPTTTGISSTSYSGLKLGLKGSYPIDLKQKWSAGAQMFFFLRPRLTESPSSGSGSHSMAQYGFFMHKKVSPNIKLVSHLDFELYASSFSGSKSLSNKHTSLSAAIYYMF